ncbi:MAG: hypothetical protein ACKVZJ_11835 [Phycisphaerales bacterium]
MPRAHLCQACGHDLALISAEREPHYGWPLVRCPTCAAPSVRAAGLGADRTAWRRTRKVYKALLGLSGRSWALVLLTMLMTAAVMTLEEETRSLAGENWRAPLVLIGVLPAAPRSYVSSAAEWFQVGSNLFLMVGWLFGCFLSVTFLFALLRHVRWWVLVLGWCLWIVAALFGSNVIIPAIVSWVETGSFGLPVADPVSGVTRASVGSAVALEGLMRTPGHIAWCVSSALMMFILTPLGLMVRRLATKLVHLQRWRARKRIRRRNQAA